MGKWNALLRVQFTRMTGKWDNVIFQPWRLEKSFQTGKIIKCRGTPV